MHTEIPLLSPHHSKSSSTLPLLLGFLLLVAILGSHTLHRHNQELAVRLSTLERRIGATSTVGNEFAAQPLPPPRNDMKEEVAAAPPANYNAALSGYKYDLGPMPEEVEFALGETAVGGIGESLLRKLQDGLIWVYQFLNKMFGALGFNIEQMRLPLPYASNWEFEIRYGAGLISKTEDSSKNPCKDSQGYISLCILELLKTRLQYKIDTINTEFAEYSTFKKIRKWLLKGLLKGLKLFVDLVIFVVKPIGCLLGFLMQGWYINIDITVGWASVNFQAMWHQYPPMINDIKLGNYAKWPDDTSCEGDADVSAMLARSSEDDKDLATLGGTVLGDEFAKPRPDPETVQVAYGMLDDFLADVDGVAEADDAPDAMIPLNSASSFVTAHSRASSLARLTSGDISPSGKSAGSAAPPGGKGPTF